MMCKVIDLIFDVIYCVILASTERRIIWTFLVTSHPLKTLER